MGPKAAGLSRSMGGAVWSPWPWPLSAQAGPYLNPHKAGFPYPLAELKDRGKAAWGGLQPLLGFWGDLYLDSRVCVCELHPHYRSPSITWGDQRSESSLPRARIGNPLLGL